MLALGDSIQNHSHQNYAPACYKTLYHIHINRADVYVFAESTTTDQTSNDYHRQGHDDGLINPHHYGGRSQGNLNLHQ